MSTTNEARVEIGSRILVQLEIGYGFRRGGYFVGRVKGFLTGVHAGRHFVGSFMEIELENPIAAGIGVRAGQYDQSTVGEETKTVIVESKARILEESSKPGWFIEQPFHGLTHGLSHPKVREVELIAVAGSKRVSCTKGKMVDVWEYFARTITTEPNQQGESVIPDSWGEGVLPSALGGHTIFHDRDEAYKELVRIFKYDAKELRDSLKVNKILRQKTLMEWEGIPLT